MHKEVIITKNKTQKTLEAINSEINRTLYTTSSISSSFGARYLDPRTSRWLSVDPAMYQGDYIPGAPINDDVRRNNNNLPGMGGIYNYVNMHVYHYGGNNPVMYIDPDGREIRVQIHRAFGFTPFYHASIRITLDSEELINEFANSDTFLRHGIRINEDEPLYLTLGAERNFFGRLVGSFNRPSDLDLDNKTDSYIIIPINEIASIYALLEASENYENNLMYNLFPTIDNSGFNSNSYISGLLVYAGLPILNFNNMMPGWDKPIPINGPIHGNSPIRIGKPEE